jgi:hypothetical protein
MITRRAFLRTLAGIAPILGGAGLCLSSPLWERLLPAGGTGERHGEQRERFLPERCPKTPIVFMITQDGSKRHR